MKIKVTQPYNNMYYLFINEVKIGEWICGKDKKYLNPEKWAKEQLKKRNIVLDRNIERLEEELSEFKKEQKKLNK